VLYASDWSIGLGGWPASYGWTVEGGLLRNDGSDFGDGNWLGGLWNLHWVAAPYVVPTDLTHYAVEAEIRLAQRPACGSFGLVVRGAQQVGIHDCQGNAPPVVSLRTHTPALLAATPMPASFDPSREWHVYRIEVRGDEIRALVDGAVIATSRDASLVGGGAVGLWDDHTQLTVRAFSVSPIAP
jgi:hypothetical protein